MKLAAILLLAVCVVLLDTGSHVQAIRRGGGRIIGPGGRNRCWLRCRPGWRCVIRRRGPVCVPFTFRPACFQPMIRGPCFAAIRRFFYNRFTGRCQRFIYGGCGGNLNNFYTWRQCQRRCARRSWPITPFNPILFSSDKSTSDDS